MTSVMIFAGEETYELMTVFNVVLMSIHFSSIRGYVAPRLKTKAKVEIPGEAGIVMTFRSTLSLHETK